jgi:hypothetical protein
MGKKESENTNQPLQNDNEQRSGNSANEGQEQHAHHDRSARHVSEIDRREGEMNHGETGFRGFDQPDNRA